MMSLTYLSLLFIVCSTIYLKVNAEDKLNDDETSNKNLTANVRFRILEGVVSREIDYRYQVAIMRVHDGSPYLTCGGAIIHRRYILTAAHCVNNYRSNQLVVRHGGVCGPRPGSPQNEMRSFHRVTKIFIPKVYSDLPCRKHHNDIAILKVSQAFDLTDFTRYAKVNLPEPDADYEGLMATVTGYGPDYGPQKEQNRSSYLQYVYHLRSMPTTVMSNEECQYLSDVVLTESSLCAKALNPASQTCFEDDGGPLVHDGTIVGILNDRRCNFQKPELFTRVSAYLHFIETVLNHQMSYDILVL